MYEYTMNFFNSNSSYMLTHFCIHIHISNILDYELCTVIFQKWLIVQIGTKYCHLYLDPFVGPTSKNDKINHYDCSTVLTYKSFFEFLCIFVYIFVWICNLLQFCQNGHIRRLYFEDSNTTLDQMTSYLDEILGGCKKDQMFLVAILQKTRFQLLSIMSTL